MTKHGTITTFQKAKWRARSGGKVERELRSKSGEVLATVFWDPNVLLIDLNGPRIKVIIHGLNI